MRSHKATFLAGAVLALAALAMFWGCGDDEEAAPTNWGSLDDPQFQAVNSQFEALLDSTVTQFTEAFSAIEMLPAEGDDPVMYGPGDPGGVTDSLVVSYAAGWHTIHFEWHNQLGYVACVNDSIQFLRNGQPTQEGGDLEELRYRHRWSWTAPDTTVTYLEANGHSLYDFEGLNAQTATVNGTNGFNVETKFVSPGSVTHRDINIDASLNGFTVQKTGTTWSQGCPTAGQFTATVTMTYQYNDEEPVQTEWNFSATFQSGSVHTVATSAGYTWSYSRDLCTPPTN